MEKRADAVIVAAGCGIRSGLSYPKQFFEVGGRPVLAYTAEAFLSYEGVKSVVIVLPEENFEEYRAYMQKFTDSDRVKYVCGGKERMNSVYNGLLALEEDHAPVVLIHDGVRPFVTERIITDCIESAERFGTALAAVKVTDTVKRVKNGIVADTVDREELYLAQTPQAFLYELIIAAYDTAFDEGKSFTDDCGVCENIGARIRIVNGSKDNIKLTLPEDFEKLK